MTRRWHAWRARCANNALHNAHHCLYLWANQSTPGELRELQRAVTVAERRVAACARHGAPAA